MTAHDLIFCNPPLDHNRPALGVVFTNDTGHPICLVLSLELSQSPNESLATVVLHGVDNPARKHTVELTGPATVRRVVVAVVARPGEGDKPRDISLEVATPGAACTARVLSATPCPQ